MDPVQRKRNRAAITRQAAHERRKAAQHCLKVIRPEQKKFTHTCVTRASVTEQDAKFDGATVGLDLSDGDLYLMIDSPDCSMM